MENVLIHEAANSEKVVDSLSVSKLKPQFAEMVEDGSVWGFYYQDGSIVCEDDQGEVHEDVEA